MNDILAQSESYVKSQITKPFNKQGNFTVIDNIILDCIMPILSPNAWKILCFILRKTRGWQKDEDKLSFTQIMAGTGIKNRNTISKAISQLEKDGYILVHRPDDKKTPNTYSLNRDYELVQKSYQENNGTSTEIVPDLVQKSYPQKKEININNNSPQSEENEFPKLDQAFAEVSRLYKNEINPMLGPATADILKDLVDTYPLDWIEKAFKAAVKANVRRLNYVEGILKRWQIAGHPTLAKQKQEKESNNTEHIDRSQYVEAEAKEHEPVDLAVDEDWLTAKFAEVREGLSNDS